MRIGLGKVFLLLMVLLAISIDVDVRYKAKVKVKLPKIKRIGPVRQPPRRRGKFHKTLVGRSPSQAICFSFKDNWGWNSQAVLFDLRCHLNSLNE